MHELESASTTEGLPVAPSLGAAIHSLEVPLEEESLGARVVLVTLVAIGIGVVAGFAAQALTYLIALITNLAYFGRFSVNPATPDISLLGAWSIAVPVLGALVVGLLARYGSPAIRGHGIPEVMEKVLYGESRIPARLMFLKPISASVAIGTGGPFGAEGPIIATGGALGSMVGQIMDMTSDERKVLLAAGAAAGMAATFGTPVSAVLLAVELLLFEYRARSIVPVAMASAAATALRYTILGGAPAFHVPLLAEPSGGAVAIYALVGLLVGLLSVWVTRLVYRIEDLFEHLPVHWAWWPAIGAVVVGVVGVIDPRTLGVGYGNIEGILSGNIVGISLLMLVALKFISWSIYLGSGTSGGTLAPMFTIGGGAGGALGAVAAAVAPSIGVDPRIAALVGMAAIFAGASHALLASIIFAFEATRQPLQLLPLLAGCGSAYLVSRLMMRSSIMTEKLARRGALVRNEYSVDRLAGIPVSEKMSRDVVTVLDDVRIGDLRLRLLTDLPRLRHQGFPVVDRRGHILGVITRREIFGPEIPEDRCAIDLVQRRAIVIFADSTLRDAADQMLRHDVGRLPVTSRSKPGSIVGIITRSDVLSGAGRSEK